MRHGSHIDPPNRFQAIRREADLEHLEWDDEPLSDAEGRTVEYLFDDSRSIVAENDSPDIPFRYGANPYRGCEHGCSYCYARNTHEYLGLNAGLDFETKIVVKRDAPALLRQFLSRKAWRPEMIAFSGVTDCYQPAERQFRLTRSCLEVACEFRQPVGVITKNALVVRDREVLASLASEQLAHVFLSITTLDAELARVMEPRTSTPAARLRAVKELAEAGIPVGVNIAPVIPGLNDSEVPAILEAAAAAGASAAGWGMLRLPLTVEPVFFEWLKRTQPQRYSKIEHRIREVRGDQLGGGDFGKRMRGGGPIADSVANLFKVFARRHGLDAPLPPLDCSKFRVPTSGPKQMSLF